MKTLLQINASLYSGHGRSSALATRFAGKWQQSNPDGRVIFIGIRDVEFVYAEELAMGHDVRRESLDAALRNTDRMAA